MFAKTSKKLEVQPSLIRNIPFISLSIGLLTSQIAANLTIFLLGLLIYSRTNSNAAVSGIFMAHGVPALIFGLIAGAIVDRIDRRQVLIWGGIIRALLVASLPFLLKSPAAVYLVVFLNSMLSQFVYPAQVPMVPKIVHPSDLVTANSVFSFAFYSSMAIGFIGAGPLLRYTGETGSLVIMAVFYLISALTTAYLPKDGDMKTFVRAIKTMDLLTILTKVGDNIMTGIRYVRTTPALFESMMLLTVTQITFAILGSLGPGFADTIMGIDVLDASLVMIGPTVAGVLVGSVWVGAVGYAYSQQKLINVGIVSAGVVLLCISLTVYLNRFTSFSWLFADWVIVPLELFLFFILGIANSFLDVPANTILQHSAEESMRGKVYGLLAASVGGIGILPVLVGGILADTIGVGKVILFLGLAIALFGIRRVRYH